MTVLGLLLAIGLVGLWLYRYRQHRQRAKAQAMVQRRNEAIVAASGEGVLELDIDGQVCFANPTALRLLGYEAAELLGINYRNLMSVGELPGSQSSTRVGYTTDMLRGIGALLRCKNGRNLPVEYRMLPLRHEEMAVSVIVFRDLTDRSRIDVMLADMQYLAQVGAWEMTVGSARISVSEGISRRLRLSGSRVAALHHVLSRLTRGARRDLLQAARAAIESGRDFDLELQLSSNGWVRCIGKPERIDGVTIRLYGALQDIAERKRAEQALREMRDFFGTTLDAIPFLIMYVDQQQRLSYCNHSPLRAALDLTDAALGGALATVLEARQHADLLVGIKQALAGQASTLVRPLNLEQAHRQVHCSFVPQAQGCLLVVLEVTELKMLEARLYQAEKMQAVGQLTGGVAHDFNNLLGVILGNLQLIERDVESDSPVARKVLTAMRAAMRGTELTKRLLNFARRQVLDPVIIDLHQQLPLFAELIQRTLSDTMEMRLRVAADIWRIKTDLGQLENAVLNLVLNANDAMPDGGQLTVAARNFQPDAVFLRQHADLQQGDYVEISVADTGVGIPSQILSRVFEPFFTTKEVGKGSGLGLAMVHGFAKQSGGTVYARSELGRGTCIGIVLPRCVETASQTLQVEADTVMPRGTEVVLVVEDDTDLRATTVLALQQLGYRVLEASSGEAALRLLAERPQVDLLFTDIIMPGGVLGPELAQRARQWLPGLQVLLTTGYLGDPVLLQAGPLAQEALLAKPFRNEELAVKLRTLLD